MDKTQLSFSLLWCSFFAARLGLFGTKEIDQSQNRYFILRDPFRHSLFMSQYDDEPILVNTSIRPMKFKKNTFGNM